MISSLRNEIIHGGTRYLPYVLTEQGIMMLSGLLKSDVAAKVNVQIIDAFVAMRKYISSTLLNQNFINNLVYKHDEEIKLLKDSFDKLQEKKKVNTIFFEGQIYDAYSLLLDILKSSGVKFANKFGVAMVDKIPGKALTAINKKVGFRFVTKFGETGIINLGKVVPVVGGFVGGGIDVASTKIIGKNAYKIFVKGELPIKEEIEDIIINESDYDKLDDIDTKTLNEAVQGK